MKSLDYFPADYFEARERFLSLAARAGAQTASYPIGARGPEDRPLSIDTAYLGAAQPRRLLVVLSGTHGVEGFAGSALQQQWLDRGAPDLPPDGGCLLIHAVNPYGFAWCRRTNENNVDLNRNALERFPGPPNPVYAGLDAWLNPRSVPPRLDLFALRGLVPLLRYGPRRLQRAILEGQYEYPQGLFYGGARTEASIQAVVALLGDARWRRAERVVALDLHTGYGRYGTYVLMVDLPPDTSRYADLARWFGAAYVSSSRAPGAVAYPISGGLTERLARLLAPRAHAALLEFGTYSATRVLAALRRENRAYHHAGVESRAHAAARAILREMFCPRDPAWRAAVLAQGAAVLEQAARACFSASPDAAAPAPRRAE